MNQAYSKKRIERLFQHVNSSSAGEVDAIVFANAVEPHMDLGFFYVTGLTAGVFENSMAVAFPDGRVKILTSPLEESIANRTGMEVIVSESHEDRGDCVKKALEGATKIGFDSRSMVYSTYLSLSKTRRETAFIDVSESIKECRLVKDEIEIDRTREACRMASDAAEKVKDMLHEGAKEYEIAAELTYMMQKQGATGNSFNPVIAFGPNSADPHYLAGDVAAKQGDALLLDFGCMYKRYASDITRTYYLGKADSEQKRMYETVLEAQLIGIDSIAPGVDGAEVDRHVREHIDGTSFKGRFIHSTGHSIGLSVHDGGTLSYRRPLTLEPGMIFTVEPGIYIPGKYGVRIEDDVLVTKNGVEILTSASKDLIEL